MVRTARLGPTLFLRQTHFTKHGSPTGHCTYERSNNGLHDPRSARLCSLVPSGPTCQTSSSRSADVQQGVSAFADPSSIILYASCSSFGMETYWRRQGLEDRPIILSEYIFSPSEEASVSMPTTTSGGWNAAVHFLKITPVHAV